MNSVIVWGRWTFDATSNKRLIGTTCLVVATCWTLCYAVAASIYFFHRSILIAAIASLRIVEPERVIAHETNLIIALNVLFVIGLGTIVLEWFLCRHGVTAFFRKPRQLYPNEPAWFAVGAWGAALACSVLVPLFFLRGRLMLSVLFAEDGPVEWFTAIAFLVAAIGGGVALYRIRSGAERRFLRVWIALFGLGCFWVGMEEISWGQRIFGWPTPEALSRLNTQNEANLHNIFTDYFNPLYFWGGLAFFAFFAWATVQQVRHPQRAMVRWLPHYALLPLTALISGFSFHLEANELVEPIAGAWVVLFAWQLNWANGNRSSSSV